MLIKLARILVHDDAKGVSLPFAAGALALPLTPVSGSPAACRCC